ncbi:hypothetical protein AAFN46_19110 [Pseudomonas sp. CAU 1711]|uniref:hypothetical protein n=1 Tax=Pseudomonas sp. CAU 1711 TaxID=3140356 RepID=UPI003260F808
MNRYQGDKRMDDAKESTRSKLMGQVDKFLADGGKIEQVPGGKTGMTKYLKKLASAKEASEQLKRPDQATET